MQRYTHFEADYVSKFKSSITSIKDLGFFVWRQKKIAARTIARTILVTSILFQPLPQGKESDEDISENNNNVVRILNFYNITICDP